MIGLKELKTFVDKLNRERSRDWKLSILSQHIEFSIVLSILYNNKINFNIRSKSILNYGIVEKPEYDKRRSPLTIAGFISVLAENEYSGEDLTRYCSWVLFENKEYLGLLLSVIDKDLNCGISTKTINRIYPNLIPTFEVPLAKDYKEGLCDFENEDWEVSRKYDGVRCLCFIENGEVNFYSRNGIEFHTLGTLKGYIIDRGVDQLEGLILDGEVCIRELHTGIEDFQAVQGEIQRKDYTIPYPKFYIFGCYKISEFRIGLSNNVGYHKIKLNSLLPNSAIELVNQTPVKSLEHLEEIKENMPSYWEGLMLKKMVPTQFKRSKNLLKVKVWKDQEYIVLGTVPTVKTIDEKEVECVGSLIISHKGYGVKIGSGIIDAQRLAWFHYPNLIVGKTITVKYFEETIDKKGEYSLRFPIFKGIREVGI